MQNLNKKVCYNVKYKLYTGRERSLKALINKKLTGMTIPW